MICRRIRLGAVLVVACLAPLGCASAQKAKHSESVDTAYRDEEDAVKDEDLKPEISKGFNKFFKGTRLPGAMSDEGAEIERHLGVQ
jgi:hypothetical protein